MDLDLNFQLSLGNESAPSLKIPASAAPKSLPSDHKFDLQLSLSVGPSESVITNANTIPASPHQDVFHNLVTVVSVPTVDEGSTSSRWKTGNNLSPYIHISEENAAFLSKKVIPGKPIQSYVPQLPPTSVQNLKSPTASTSEVVLLPQRSSSAKNCQFLGCGKGARGASGFCIAHGGGRRCQKVGCQKGAEGRTIFCKAHGGVGGANSLGALKVLRAGLTAA
uniref:WRKY19-like zinc finger domain-containing protein n=1 Tax=Ananas comosus var. bracteatus TaxID=296719 RepID=A0A6V7QJM1_ANACO|nr:unnamed protein product [Ananas comosus var. bracteatus]